MLLKTVKSQITGALILLSSASMFAQLPVDGFYPKKNTVASALSYDYRSYDEFYIGNNLGNGPLVNNDLEGGVESSIVSLYAQYGVTDRLSLTLTLPYISVSGQDSGTPTVDGLQDLGFFVKGLISETTFKNSSRFSLGGAIGITFPVSDYDGEGLLSIGNTATSYKAETILHYDTNFGIFIEGKFGSAVNASDDFDIPPALFYSAKIGYIHKYFYFHSELDIQNSVLGVDILGEGFDGPQDLPNTEVDYTRLLFNLYVPFYQDILGVSANYATTLDGRNVNDESGFGVGLVYNFK